MQPIEPLMPWQLGPDYPRWTETLRDHSKVVIRPIRVEDAAAERVFIESMSPQARRYRFLGQMQHPSSELIEQLTWLDYVRDLAFAAVVHDDARDKFVGVSRYSTSSDGTACECAITVLDDWQNKGLGAILMKHLIDVARARDQADVVDRLGGKPRHVGPGPLPGFPARPGLRRSITGDPQTVALIQ
ncbi:MAG: N-acetyltransferase family protein [Luteimonas sp.]